ncbi:MAG: DNRLRE domain-containing protein [Thermoanaerobaculales bacterium]|jgi:hypothetical protein|nr:DNRLRE domain-containing protein [Thermoanaerobaculales bacterium]
MTQTRITLIIAFALAFSPTAEAQTRLASIGGDQPAQVRVAESTPTRDLGAGLPAGWNLTSTEVVTLEPAADVTLYEEDDSTANGSGSYLFTGATESQNGAAQRRALLLFDIESAIPVGATITDAVLELTVSRTISGDQTVELRRVTESWGEGPSDPSGQEGRGAAAEDGDATWAHRAFPSNLWGSLGGSFESTASGSASVGGAGRSTFSSTAGMVADVQSWLDDPMGNFGWALVMPSPATGSAKRFNSRENASASTRPVLTITYEGSAPTLDERVFIPAVARVGGVGDSFFVTTVDIHNSGSASSAIRVGWLPRNTNNSEPELSDEIVIEPGETVRYGDLLDELFGLEEGVGAAVVLSDSDGIEVMTRTFNQTAEGTFGQSLPGVPENELILENQRALVLFLTENTDLRSNLGLVNGVNRQITVRWELFASDGSSLTTGQINLPPWGNRQLNRVLEDFAPVEAGYAHVWTTTTDGAFTCYGSVLDNLTSDPTTVLPR